MDDFGHVNEESRLDDQIRLQLLIGIIAVPLLVWSTVFINLGQSYITWNEYRTLGELYYQLGYPANIAGSAFLVVGTIAILKRNKSNLAWILAGVYIFGWIWQFAFSYVIFPGVFGLENIDSIFVLSVIGYIRAYSIIAILLYAWWSIQDRVSYRSVYYSYLIYIALSGFVSYVFTGLLFGFGSHQIWNPEESFALKIPSIVISILGYLILLLFFISQLVDHRKTTIFEKTGVNYQDNDTFTT